MPDVGLCAQMACVWEVTAAKVGNVHRFRDFKDVTYLDYLLSAAAIAPILARASQQRVGTTILEAIRATRQVVRTNTNLGIVLLLAPLATVADGEDPRQGVERVLSELDVEDARAVYEAIRLAGPGGLGQVTEQDVATEPTQPLRQVMGLAADRDLIAGQYANGFAEVFDLGAAAVMVGLNQTGSLECAILFAHLSLLSLHPDSLIARKRGPLEAAEASTRARTVLARGWPHQRAGWAAFKDFDTWLRSEGHSRNPGTSADLVTASLFILLRQQQIPIPVPWAWGFSSAALSR
jgi:triphosphoribosyl-dephospho-CoA synthase